MTLLSPSEVHPQGSSPIRTPTAAQLDALLHLAFREQTTGNIDTAISLYRFSLSLRPDHVEARKGLALCLFLREDWEAAWAAFDVRFALTPQPPEVKFLGPDGQMRPCPRWVGGPPPQTLLVMDEQGLGDTLHFCRFLADVAERGVKVYAAIDPRLRALVATMNLPVEILSGGMSGAVRGIKGWTALMDLPRALGLGPEEYARRVPYLAADPHRIARWRARIGSSGFKVGIAWQGSPDKSNDDLRSLPLEQLAALADLEGVRLISLQKGFGEEQIPPCSFAGRIETLGPDFDAGPDAFLDTAAVMASLDLVVTVDTAIAHLAGALGRPVHLLLAHPEADWRWLARPHDTVWYPSMRLYRQSAAGAWSGPVSRCARDIRVLLGQEAVDDQPLLAPVSAGELLDKITILGLKRERIQGDARRANVLRELSLLGDVRSIRGLTGPAVDAQFEELRAVNETLWEIEDRLREHEGRGDFGPEFVDLARRVYLTNDRRARIKKAIDRLTGSTITEEKSYAG